MIGHSRSKFQSRPTLACDQRRFFSGPWMKTFVLGSHQKALRIFWNYAESVHLTEFACRVFCSSAMRDPLIFSFDTGKINLHDGADLAESPLMELKVPQFKASQNHEVLVKLARLWSLYQLYPGWCCFLGLSWTKLCSDVSSPSLFVIWWVFILTPIMPRCLA